MNLALAFRSSPTALRELPGGRTFAFASMHRMNRRVMFPCFRCWPTASGVPTGRQAHVRPTLQVTFSRRAPRCFLPRWAASHRRACASLVERRRCLHRGGGLQWRWYSGSGGSRGLCIDPAGEWRRTLDLSLANFTVAGDAASLVTADFTNDWKADLAVANNNSTNITVLTNTTP